jgi:hypothetical protein
MGSRRTPRLSESAICRAYEAGQSRADICMRAAIYDRELLAILRRNGVPPRTHCEIKAISNRKRLGTLALNPLRKRCLCA